jgi:hypothetical protein
MAAMRLCLGFHDPDQPEQTGALIIAAAYAFYGEDAKLEMMPDGSIMIEFEPPADLASHDAAG